MAEPFKISNGAPLRILLNPFAWFFWTLDFLIWLLSIVGPIRWLLHFRRPQVATRDGDVWRYKGAQKGYLTKLVPDCESIHDLVQRSVALYASKPLCGTRTYLGEHQAEGARFPLKKFGETTWTTYGEFGDSLKHFGLGLLSLGLAPAPTGTDLQLLDGAHTMLIFEETCAEWLTAAMGALSQSIVVATSYATLGTAALVEAINETGARVVMCNIKDVPRVAAACSVESGLKVTTIVYTTNYSTERTAAAPAGSGLKVVSVEEVVGLGRSSASKAFAPPTPQHLAVIMYTSGSTGKPKGVMIKHSCLAASVVGVGLRLKDFGLQEAKEVALAYLPAAHILELVSEISSCSLGMTLAFADPKTLSSRGAVRQRPDGTLSTSPGYPYPPGAIQEFRPTSMAAVPKIWDILKKGVEETVGNSKGIKRWLFQVGYSARNNAVFSGRETPFFKALIFRKLNMLLGGRLKVGLSGGGPISADVQTFIRTAFCIPLIQGYALTETTCAGTIQMTSDTRPGVVGHPVGSVEIKLRSCLDAAGLPEATDRKGRAYLASDTRHHDGTACVGRGEVLIRGPSVSAGYFRQKDKTMEVFDEDGWFHTGDVALMLPDGALMIVDRVKNLVKLKSGEYIALEAMEKEYSTSPYVNGLNGGIMCYGDGDMDKPVALVQANCAELRKWWAASGNQECSSDEELCQKPEAAQQVLASLLAAGRSGGLASNELLAAVALIAGAGPTEGAPSISSPWTAENGGLTASNKLNRRMIRESYAAAFDTVKKKGIK